MPPKFSVVYHPTYAGRAGMTLRATIQTRHTTVAYLSLAYSTDGMEGLGPPTRRHLCPSEGFPT